jgi:hypothetical protein
VSTTFEDGRTLADRIRRHGERLGGVGDHGVPVRTVE